MPRRMATAVGPESAMVLVLVSVVVVGIGSRGSVAVVGVGVAAGGRPGMEMRWSDDGQASLSSRQIFGKIFDFPPNL